MFRWSPWLADIFQEIDEDLRRDRAAELWLRYRWAIITAVVLVIAGTAAFVGWQNYRQQQDKVAGAAFAEASVLVDKDPAKAEAALRALADNGSDGYRLLARFQAASLAAKNKDQAGAVAAFKAIATDRSVIDSYRDLATLLAALYGLDSEKPADIIALVQPLTIAPNPWRFTALEVTALAKLKAGDQDASIKLYQQLADDLDAPSPLRKRAAEIVNAFGHQG
jgi:hypothetical protein